MGLSCSRVFRRYVLHQTSIVRLERCKLILVKRMHVSQPFSGLFQLGVLHSTLMSMPILRRRRRGNLTATCSEPVLGGGTAYGSTLQNHYGNFCRYRTGITLGRAQGSPARCFALADTACLPIDAHFHARRAWRTWRTWSAGTATGKE